VHGALQLASLSVSTTRGAYRKPPGNSLRIRAEALFMPGRRWGGLATGQRVSAEEGPRGPAAGGLHGVPEPRLRSQHMMFI